VVQGDQAINTVTDRMNAPGTTQTNPAIKEALDSCTSSCNDTKTNVERQWPIATDVDTHGAHQTRLGGIDQELLEYWTSVPSTDLVVSISVEPCACLHFSFSFVDGKRLVEYIFVDKKQKKQQGTQQNARQRGSYNFERKQKHKKQHNN
jgi:hypothetical protein